MRATWLWTLAVLLMLVAAAWQRRTGPSYPLRGDLPTAARFELPRSHETTSGAPVSVPAVRPAGELLWRRYPTAEGFASIPLGRRGDSLTATLPAQPPAGKVEYYVVLHEVSATPAVLRVPAREAAVLRYRGPVQPAVLVVHVLLMFLAMLVAVRAGLGAAAGRNEPRLAALALVGFTLGGLLLGPIVQKQAFGAYWTGVPWGWDLTDNKTLIMWAAWLMACLAPLRRPPLRRPLVLAAAALTLVVYVIPHSMHGSQLEYERPAAAAPARG